MQLLLTAVDLGEFEKNHLEKYNLERYFPKFHFKLIFVLAKNDQHHVLFHAD